jgi:HAD superfamily phosphatase
MDGVLVDVTDSYRKAIQETVEFFTGTKAEPEEIQEYKQKGGYNNDWDLTQAIIAKRGKTPPRVEVVQKFQELYLGNEGTLGFIENEKWLLPKPQLETLRKEHRLGIVTGRPKEETVYILRKFGVESFFDAVVAMEDYPPEKAKPDQLPIRLALEKLGMQEAVYVGDSVDDIASAKGAGVRAFGCIPPQVSASNLRELLREKGAEKILEKISDITEALK